MARLVLGGAGRKNPPHARASGRSGAPASRGWFVVVAVLGALFTAAVNLRNVRLWLLRATGQRATGVVTGIEMVTDSAGAVLRRPKVAFTTGDGREIVSAPLLYRPRSRLAKGSPVIVSYARRNPTRLVVHGYDFRTREVVYAALGMVVAIVISTAYLNL